MGTTTFWTHSLLKNLQGGEEGVHIGSKVEVAIARMVQGKGDRHRNCVRECQALLKCSRMHH